MNENDNEKKLEIPEKKKRIDDDWKRQVQAEKQKLSQENAAKKDLLDDNERVAYLNMLQSMLSQVQMNLGMIPNPMTNQREVDPNQAQMIIDFLSAINKKTKENQTSEEKQLLGKPLSDLKLVFSQILAQYGTAETKTTNPTNDNNK
ncbi:MAG: DUF1844 domain-containing protein [Planctomycetes bacterium]|nr:DUF1844 domain-containing protein [Planctomycetota bacterium]